MRGSPGTMPAGWGWRLGAGPCARTCAWQWLVQEDGDRESARGEQSRQQVTQQVTFFPLKRRPRPRQGAWCRQTSL